MIELSIEEFILYHRKQQFEEVLQKPQDANYSSNKFQNIKMFVYHWSFFNL